MHSHLYRLDLGDKKKKKKKKPKKKKAAAAAPSEQSEPPRVGLTKIFTSGVFPVGEIQEYKDECVILSLLNPAMCCNLP